jgi:hypothetical protein
MQQGFNTSRNIKIFRAILTHINDNSFEHLFET